MSVCICVLLNIFLNIVQEILSHVTDVIHQKSVVLIDCQEHLPRQHCWSYEIDYTKRRRLLPYLHSASIYLAAHFVTQRIKLSRINSLAASDFSNSERFLEDLTYIMLIKLFGTIFPTVWHLFWWFGTGFVKLDGHY